MHRLFVLAAAVSLAAVPLHAEIVTVPSGASVKTTMDALENAVKENGQQVHARIASPPPDEAEEGPEVLVFSDPDIDKAITSVDPRTALVLPVRVLVYEAPEGEVQLVYQAPETIFSDLDVRQDSDYVMEMRGTLQLVTNKASIARD